MKKNYLYIFATALVVGFSSCSDFLDRYPQEELSDGSFWKTPDDANKVVSDLYGYLSTWDQDNDINSDNATMGIKWAAGNISVPFITLGKVKRTTRTINDTAVIRFINPNFNI